MCTGMGLTVKYSSEKQENETQHSFAEFVSRENLIVCHILFNLCFLQISAKNKPRIFASFQLIIYIFFN